MKRSKLCVVAALFLMSALNVHADAGDDIITTARDAASRGDTTRLSTLRTTAGNHVLAPYIDYWLLSAQVARKSQPLPNEDIRSFLRQNEGSWLAEKLRSEWLKRVAKEGSDDLFNSEYARLAQPDQELQCDAILSSSEAKPLAMQNLEQQWLTLMDLPDTCQSPMQSLVNNGRMKTDDVWMRFRRLVENKRFSGAHIAASWLNPGESPNDVLLNRALNDPARYLASAAARDTSSRASREITIAALTRMARNDAQVAYVRWKSLDNSAFTKSEQAYLMGQFAWMAALSQQPDAVAWFAEAKEAPMSDEQSAWAVRSALRASNWSAVRRAIANMSPAQQAQPDWTYWQGRALMAQGKTQEAQSLFQKYAGEPNFYGILSIEALGQNFTWPQPAVPPSKQELSQAQTNPGIQRAVALYRIGMRTEGMREWNWSIRTANDRTLLAMAEYARQQGIYDRAINTAMRTKQQHDYNLRYLAPYYETFSTYAQTNGLDLSWVYGLTRQESRFVYDIRSAAGAQGLMQVMPSTGKWIASKAGIRNYHPGWLSQVDTNVQLGTAYLRIVLDGLSNSPAMASAGYNAGPGRAKRWRGAQPMEGAIYAETIPITETRDYVKQVMANATVYATLFNGKPASLTTRLGTITPSSGGDISATADPRSPAP